MIFLRYIFCSSSAHSHQQATVIFDEVAPHETVDNDIWDVEDESKDEAKQAQIGSTPPCHSILLTMPHR